jgi:hypothetical protein
MTANRSTSTRPSATAAPLTARTIFEPEDDRGGHRYVMGGAVSCNVGKIVNLSERGALVVSRVPLGSTVPFSLTDGACRVACTAKVMRTRRLGEHRHSCALQFEDLQPEHGAAIAHMIARHHIPQGQLRRDAA